MAYSKFFILTNTYAGGKPKIRVSMRPNTKGPTKTDNKLFDNLMRRKTPYGDTRTAISGGKDAGEEDVANLVDVLSALMEKKL